MSTRTSRRYVAVTVALLALVGASGCTNDSAEPAPLPPQSSSATAPATASEPASASGSPTAAPSMPDAAKGTSAASAEVFARHYVDLINYAMNDRQDANSSWTLSSGTLQDLPCHRPRYRNALPEVRSQPKE